MKRILQTAGVLTLVLAMVLLGLTAYGVFAPLPMKSAVINVSIEAGQPVRSIAQTLTDSGVDVSPGLLYGMFRLSGKAKLLRAGSYEFQNGESAWDVLQKISRGQEALQALVLVEGWNFRQFRQALNKSVFLKHQTSTLSDEEIMTLLGRAGVPAEGRFFPDTYTYGRGDSDVRILTRALAAMDRQLSTLWPARASGLIFSSPEQALVLASIVEKETGKAVDRVMIASVFHNRLTLNMPLQTDPTVIYGLGASFDGNLRKIDLQTDHPWNTYTRKGLPPTPIAMPGKAALQAALHPENSQALYFVARGDGSSQFSQNLAEHNAAVNRYQRRESAHSAPEAAPYQAQSRP